MFPFCEINTGLRQQVVESNLYDLYRLVDILTHEVYSFAEGDEAPVPTGMTCHHIWGSEGPCANCTSRVCINRHEGIMKIEFLNGQVLLIYSTPVTINDYTWALELIKDVTTSFMIPDSEHHDNIEITEMIEKFNELAVRDTFTKLYNKPFVLNRLATVIDECEDRVKAGLPFIEDEAKTPVMAMIDIDFYKEVNDKYGHNMGDYVLLHLAREFDNYAKTLFDGWAARFGGDEFLIGAPEGLTPEDRERFNKMISDVQNYKFNFEGQLFSITLSCGFAYLVEGDTPRTLLERADRVMYEEKKLHHKLRK